MLAMDIAAYDVVILSDLHLGSEVSRASEALELLRSIRFQRLILLGDIFCDLNFRRLKKEHWHFLSYIRKLSNPKRNTEVIWVEGNHDHGLVDVMSHLVGVPAYREFIWESDGEKHIAVHGHQFDKFIVKNKILTTSLVSHLYLFIQKIAYKGRFVARMLDRLNTRWQRLTPKVAEGAIAYARARGATRIYCGHTHEATTQTQDGISYWNAGAWTHTRSTYITIKGREVKTHEHVGRGENSPIIEENKEIYAPFPEVLVPAGQPGDVCYEDICE
jgi:UDP-2,3-diacylglucosamine pyrophosphatase LpxH